MPSELFDPARHEALTGSTWDGTWARVAIERICAAAENEFDQRKGNWLLHPLDDPPEPGARSFNFYWGAAGVVWTLRHLQAQGAVKLLRDYSSSVVRYPDRLREEAAAEMHGSASYLFGQSAALLQAWMLTRRSDFANRLHDVVQGNLHNPVHEPLWGNAGSALAAIRMAEASDDPRWPRLVALAIDALIQDMQLDPETGTWVWEQDLYGSRTRYLGAGHGLAGNAYAVLRGARFVDAASVQTMEHRVLQTLLATALVAASHAVEGAGDLVNWHALVDRARTAKWLAEGRKPLVQDCHGAPGIVCRLGGVSRTAQWDSLLRGAGELTWHAGPLSKGPSLCHGTAGSAMACLKLWHRFAEPVWLERARRLAMHAAGQVDQTRARYNCGRHSLWTGDLGVACALWNCIEADHRFPTLDHF